MAGGEVTVAVDAPPAAVYDLVSAVERTGEWSPECERCEWLDGTTGPLAGARFRGHNRDKGRTWTMDAVIDEAAHPTAFAFHTEHDGVERTRWGYRLAARVDGGTDVTEWWDRIATPGPVGRVLQRVVLGDRAKRNEANIRASLGRIKAIVEETP